ncbi:PKD domain-containing protein [Planctomycetota bacterium]
MKQRTLFIAAILMVVVLNTIPSQAAIELTFDTAALTYTWTGSATSPQFTVPFDGAYGFGYASVRVGHFPGTGGWGATIMPDDPSAITVTHFNDPFPDFFEEGFGSPSIMDSFPGLAASVAGYYIWEGSTGPVSDYVTVTGNGIAVSYASANPFVRDRILALDGKPLYFWVQTGPPNARELFPTQIGTVHIDEGPPQPTGFTIRGTVLDAATMPDEPLALAGAKVTANGESVYSNDLGEFVISGLPAQDITVTAEKSGYRNESQFLPYPPAAQCPYKNLCDGPDSLQNVDLHLAPIDATLCNTTFRPIKDGFHYENIGTPGFCLGMSFAAFNLWKDEETLPDPRGGETDTNWLPNSDDAQAKMIRDLDSQYETVMWYNILWPLDFDLDKLCTDLNLGKARVLILGDVLGPFLQSKHAVLAYKAVKAPTRCSVWVYDPEDAEKENVITFSKVLAIWWMDTYNNTYSGCKVVPEDLLFRSDSPYKFETVAHSPVSLKLTDPDGFIVSDNINEIDWGCYQKLDVNGDGDEDEVVTILWPKEGLYSVQVIPKPDALPTDTYSLEVTCDGKTVNLAENIPISDIPDKPFVIEWTNTGINVAPIADAGEDQTVAAGDSVYLDGTQSWDAEGDDMTFSWNFTSVPEGSSAQITDPTESQTGFLADVEGTYEVSLVVNDGNVDSDVDTVIITAISPDEAAAGVLIEMEEIIQLIPPEDLHNDNAIKPLTNKIEAILMTIAVGLYQEALDKLENDILKKTNGCVEVGEPDATDWLLMCEDQETLYPLIMRAIELLERLI